MKRALVLVVLVGVVAGCSSTQSKPNWQLIAPFVEAVAEEGALIAFEQAAVAPYKGQICEAGEKIAAFLETYEDSDATLELLRVRILAELGKVNLPEVPKKLLVGIVDDVVSAAVGVAKEHYSELVASEQAKVVVVISRATARGLRDACAYKAMKVQTKAPSFLFPK